MRAPRATWTISAEHRRRASNDHSGAPSGEMLSAMFLAMGSWLCPPSLRPAVGACNSVAVTVTDPQQPTNGRQKQSGQDYPPPALVLVHAQALFHNGDDKGALKEFLWLWDNVPPSAVYLKSVRRLEVAPKLRALSDRNADARRVVSELRSSLDPQRMGRLDPLALEKWMILNHAFDEDKKTVAWFRSVQDNKDVHDVLSNLSEPLFAALVACHEWKDAGKVVTDPLEKARAQLGAAAEIIARHGDHPTTPPSEHEIAGVVAIAASRVAEIGASLHAAGRDEEAKGVRSAVIDGDTGGRLICAYVRAMSDLGQVQKEDVLLLDEAARRGFDVASMRRKIAPDPADAGLHK